MSSYPVDWTRMWVGVDIVVQSAVQRDYAVHLCSVYGERGEAVASDIQGP